MGGNGLAEAEEKIVNRLDQFNRKTPLLRAANE
jgi:hypothetical protein